MYRSEYFASYVEWLFGYLRTLCGQLVRQFIVHTWWKHPEPQIIYYEQVIQEDLYSLRSKQGICWWSGLIMYIDRIYITVFAYRAFIASQWPSVNTCWFFSSQHWFAVGSMKARFLRVIKSIKSENQFLKFNFSSTKNQLFTISLWSKMLFIFWFMKLDFCQDDSLIKWCLQKGTGELQQNLS